MVSFFEHDHLIDVIFATPNSYFLCFLIWFLSSMITRKNSFTHANYCTCSILLIKRPAKASKMSHLAVTFNNNSWTNFSSTTAYAIIFLKISHSPLEKRLICSSAVLVTLFSHSVSVHIWEGMRLCCCFGAWCLFSLYLLHNSRNTCGIKHYI